MKKSDRAFPGERALLDGNQAIAGTESLIADILVGAPVGSTAPLTESWRLSIDSRKKNAFGKRLGYLCPKDEGSVIASAYGLAMSGLRTTAVLDGRGLSRSISAFGAAAQRGVPFVVHLATTIATYGADFYGPGNAGDQLIGQCGAFQMVGANAQQLIDFSLIARKVSETTLIPGVVAHEAYLTSHLFDTVKLAETELVEAYLGPSDSQIPPPSPAQRMLFGDRRPTVPPYFHIDDPRSIGSGMKDNLFRLHLAGRRLFYTDHLPAALELAFQKFAELTGRQYGFLDTYRTDDADYLVVVRGEMAGTAKALIDHYRKERKIKIGLVIPIMVNPEPCLALGSVLKDRRGLIVIERSEQPIEQDMPLIGLVRRVIQHALENGRESRKNKPDPNYPVWSKLENAPEIFSAICGLGGGRGTTGEISAAIENVLPEGLRKRRIFPGIEFQSKVAVGPSEEIYQQSVVDQYPGINSFSVPIKDLPPIEPAHAKAIVFYGISGKDDKDIAKVFVEQVFEAFGYALKLRPSLSKKIGQLDSSTLLIDEKPVDTNDFGRVPALNVTTDLALAHLPALETGKDRIQKLLIVSGPENGPTVSNRLPTAICQAFKQGLLKLYALTPPSTNGSPLSKENAVELSRCYLSGALWSLTDLLLELRLDKKDLFKILKKQVQRTRTNDDSAWTDKLAEAIVDGFEKVTEIELLEMPDRAGRNTMSDALPIALKQKAEKSLTDGWTIHQCYNRVIRHLHSGSSNRLLADPFIASSLLPPMTGMLRDRSDWTRLYPTWKPEKCNGCGKCWTICPDSALPPVVVTPSDLCDAMINRLEGQGLVINHLRKACRTMENTWRKLIAKGLAASIALTEAIKTTSEESGLEGPSSTELANEFKSFVDQIGVNRFAAVDPFYQNLEKKALGSGGLLTIGLNPRTCKNCMACVSVCPENAFSPSVWSKEKIESYKLATDLLYSLPLDQRRFSLPVEDSTTDPVVGRFFLDRKAYLSMCGGDDACPGCGEKILAHIITGMITERMNRRIHNHVEKLSDLILRLKTHIKLKLAIDLEDPALIEQTMKDLGKGQFTLTEMIKSLDRDDRPVDSEWLARVTRWLTALIELKMTYCGSGKEENKRSATSLIISKGCSSFWSSGYPYNPFPFPWSQDLDMDGSEVAIAVFEGQMRVMAEGFAVIRMVELELLGKYQHEIHQALFEGFDWNMFDDGEWSLCPPLLLIGGDTVLGGTDLAGISSLLAMGKPIKIVVFDNQIPANQGGGESLSFVSHGLHKELPLIAVAHRNTYVLQSGLADIADMIAKINRGLDARGPALLNLYAPCIPGHGVNEDAAVERSIAARDSRIFPYYAYNPGNDRSFKEHWSIEANFGRRTTWTSFTGKTGDGGSNAGTQAYTPAHFAFEEGRFHRYFKPIDDEGNDYLALGDYLELPQEERESIVPVIEMGSGNGTTTRYAVLGQLVELCRDRASLWTMLRSIVGDFDPVVNPDLLRSEAKSEFVDKLTRTLLEMSGGYQRTAAETIYDRAVRHSEIDRVETEKSDNISFDEVPAMTESKNRQTAWIETEKCQPCDRCININPEVFGYNEENKAVLLKEKIPYKDLVKAAEQCPLKIIHPGLPGEMRIPGIEKWIERAKKIDG